MSLHSETMTAPRAPSAAPSWTRLFYWSVRREVWEHRALYIAPMAAAGVGLIGFLLAVFSLPTAMKAATPLAIKKAALTVEGPYDFVALAVLFAGLMFAVVYCLGALQGERRDRSILFWKSLPVSDLTTVLSKAVVPLVLLPPVIYATIVAAHLIMVSLGTLILLAQGIDPQQMWAKIHLGMIWLALGRGVIFLSLWYAPVCAWLLLVSAWARRMTFLWAVGPALAVAVIEWLAFHTSFVFALLRLRTVGAFGVVFTVDGEGKTYLHQLADLDPMPLLANPGLWIGLILAVAFLAAAVRLRRYADPI